ncbi:efflux RND transporter periplasmic adaptor subunit [Niabella terrae]
MGLFFSACKEPAPKKSGPSKRPSPALDAYIVRTETYAELIEVPGTIMANEVTEIFPEVSGRLVRLNVAEGKTVGKGTLLAKIYDGDLVAQLNKLKSQLAIARSNETRAAQLLKIQGISQNDYDATLLTLNNIQADINLIQTEIDRTEVRAPFSGRLGLRNISPGAYVTPATVIATINQVQELKLDFSIPEKYVGRILEGQVVHFTVQGSPETYAAKVYATQSNVEINNRSLVLRARVFGKTKGLVPGAFAKVQVGFNPNNSAIFVPSQSVIPTARGKQVILVRDGKAVFNEVEIGGRDSARVEITRGVKAGDTILASGMMTTRENADVSIGKIIQ